MLMSIDESDLSTQELQTSQTHKYSYPTIFLPPGSTRGFGNLPFSSAITANHFPRANQNSQLKVFRQPEWQVLPCWTFDDSALGQAYTAFHRTGAQSLSQAFHLQSGSTLVNVSYLLKGSRSEGFDPDTWASQVQRTFVGHVPQTVLIAGAYVLAMLMRWLVNPTPESYQAVPLVIRPTLRQRLLPHPSSIDLVSATPIREALVDRMRDFLTSIVESGLSVNWSLTVNETLIGVRHLTMNGDEEHQYFIAPDFAATSQIRVIGFLAAKYSKCFPNWYLRNCRSVMKKWSGTVIFTSSPMS